MATSVNNGVKISIGTSVAAATATEFAADTYTLILDPTDIGSFGSKSELVKWQGLTSGITNKAKGTFDAGGWEFTVAHDSADAGQTALRAAVDSPNQFNFKIELTDKPTSGASPKNTVHYFRALVMEAGMEFGGADDPTKQKFMLEIVGKIVRVNASAT